MTNSLRDFEMATTDFFAFEALFVAVERFFALLVVTVVGLGAVLRSEIN